MKKNSKNIGLVGSITHDVITLPSGKIRKGLGGILYPASVMCGLGKKVLLMTHLAEELNPLVLGLLKEWLCVDLNGIKRVPGPGNRVNLYYPEEGERQEILESVVPSLKPDDVLGSLNRIHFLVLLLISGLDITLRDWEIVKQRAQCPIWIDIHSLALSPELGQFRKYRALHDWKEWVRGVDYVQANQKEAACMLGHPGKKPNDKELISLGESILKQDAKAVLITLGEEGVLVVTPEEIRKMKPDASDRVMDTTGCGDVFCGAAVSQLMEGKPVMEAADFGLELASMAVGRAGIRETLVMTKGFMRGWDEE